jgi:hypothetical protein
MMNEGANMEWNLEGMTVTGKYLGDFPVTGKVELSRVKYGGEVYHHIVLKTPIVVYGETRERVILEHRNVETVKDSV